MQDIIYVHINHMIICYLGCGIVTWCACSINSIHNIRFKHSMFVSAEVGVLCALQVGAAVPLCCGE